MKTIKLKDIVNEELEIFIKDDTSSYGYASTYFNGEIFISELYQNRL